MQTDFEYIGIHSELGHGWKLDNKIYTYRYWNKQNYNGTTITKTSAIDKLNGYRKVGDVLAVSDESARGILRTGLWFEWAYTDRYQIPSDPRTWVNAALPNFHEHFITTSAQPFVEYEYRVTRDLSLTAGVKLARYGMDFTQFADNGKTVGSLNGAESVTHSTTYHSWMPVRGRALRAKEQLVGICAVRDRQRHSADQRVRYQGSSGRGAAETDDGEDLPGGLGREVQPGRRWTPTAYYSHFQNPYTSSPDPTGEPIFYQTGPSNTKGVEAESNILVAYGFSIYLNGTLGSAKYAQTGLWVASAPRNAETVGLTYRLESWDIGFFDKRIGQMYNDNGSVNQAVAIDPFHVTNLFLNYTVRGESTLRGTKFRLSVNNLLDKHSIVGVVPALASSATSPNDVLTLLPARSMALTVTFGFAPGR